MVAVLNEKTKRLFIITVLAMCLSTCLCDVYDHSLLGHGRVGHVVEHPWQVDLFLWEAAVSMVE